MNNYEYDIIIFYPQTDEKSEDSLWIKDFSTYLESMLNSLLDYKPKILLSSDIASIESSQNKAQKDIISSGAVYLFIISNDSIKNEAYQTKINEIFDHLCTSSKDVLKRILKIELEPTLEENQNETLQQIFTHEFFDINKFSKKAKSYDITYGAPPPENFWSKLLDLSFDIIKILHNTEEIIEQNAPKLFLAQTSPDQRSNHDNIKRELQHQGYQVVPNVKLPNKANIIQEILDKLLPQCVASIHIIGKQYGNYVDNSNQSLVELQSALVNQYTNEGNLKKFIFIPEDNRTAYGKQQLFINRLKKEKNNNTELIIGKPTEFMEIIVDSLNHDAEKKSKTQSPVKGKTYLIFDKITDKIIANIKKVSGDQDNLIQLNFTENISQNINNHEDNLRCAENVIIYHDLDNDLWLQRQLQDIKKIMGLGKTSDFKRKIIITSHTNIDLNPFLLKDFVIIDSHKKDWSLELINYWKEDVNE